MGNYATVSDIRTFKVNCAVIDLTGCDDPDIEEEITLAEQIIESITNDIFYVKTETNRFDGNGLTRLFFFPLIPYRLLTITSLTELDIDDVVLDTFIENEDFKKYDHYIETDRKFADSRPRRRFGSGGVWPKGQKNISIEGTWGRTTVPAEIKRAAILLVLERLKPGSTGLAPKDIAQAVWNDFTISFGAAEDKTGLSTGFAEVDRLLFNHVNRVDMFLAIPDEKQTYDRRYDV